MRRRLLMVLAGVMVLAAAALGGSMLAAAGDGTPAPKATAAQNENCGDDAAEAAGESTKGNEGDEEQATGPEADSAGAAALASVGEGKVLSVERDSEHGAAWEVKVAKAGGATVEAKLDSSYQVVSTETKAEDEDGPDQADDDTAEGQDEKADTDNVENEHEDGGAEVGEDC